MKKFKHALNENATCAVTGFQGTVIARCGNLNSASRYQIQPLVRGDGKMAESVWVNEDSLRTVMAVPEESSKALDNLGASPVVDGATGFTGTIAAACEYSTGPDRYLVQPVVNAVTGEYVEGHWFDSDRLSVEGGGLR